MKVAELDPRPVWKHFAELNARPRPSKREQAAVDYVQRFGLEQGLQTHVDDVGNVLIRKPATPGMEDRRTVVLQGHLDMVCQKNEGTDFDFDAEGVRMVVDGDWVRAEGTTLGADNGIGVAATLAILAADDIEHPPIEALFTIDEETGMTGAAGLRPGQLSGDILLNLDTEEETELTIGCAGGVDVTATMRVPLVEAPQGADAGAAVAGTDRRPQWDGHPPGSGQRQQAAQPAAPCDGRAERGLDRRRGAAQCDPARGHRGGGGRRRARRTPPARGDRGDPGCGIREHRPGIPARDRGGPGGRPGSSKPGSRGSSWPRSPPARTESTA